jgi:hypothetical protein
MAQQQRQLEQQTLADCFFPSLERQALLLQRALAQAEQPQLMAAVTERTQCWTRLERCHFVKIVLNGQRCCSSCLRSEH